MSDCLLIKDAIHQLYNHFKKHPTEPTELIDIEDVLLQVYQTIDNERYPEVSSTVLSTTSTSWDRVPNFI